MTEINDRDVILNLMRTANAAILTTIDRAGFPQTRAMFNLRNEEMFPKLIPIFKKHEDDFLVIFSTNTSSPKVSDIKENPAVSVYYYIQEQWQGVMLGGTIEISDDIELTKILWHEGWEKYYPKGFDDPDHTILRFIPTVARGWNQAHTFNIELG